jgi:hypothetical protein
MSYDIYVPLSGPTIAIPHVSDTLGVAFGPQAPPAPSQAPPPPPPPPVSALYGPVAAQVQAPLVPPLGQPPPSGVAAAVPRRTAADASRSMQPAALPGPEAATSPGDFPARTTYPNHPGVSRPAQSGPSMYVITSQLPTPFPAAANEPRRYYPVGSGEHVLPGSTERTRSPGGSLML